MTLLEAALALHDAGICALPAATDGTKRPAVAWAEYQHTRPTRDALIAMLDGAEGIGAVCGEVSGGLEMLELEARAVEKLDEITDRMNTLGLGPTWKRITDGYAEVSPSSGVHWLYLVPGASKPNTKLARNATGEVTIETRGQGGWTVTAPSAGRTHPTRKPWVLVAGTPATIATITPDERDAVYAVLRTFDETPARPVSHNTTADAPTVRPFDSFATPNPSGGLSPGDDYAARTSWRDILEPAGWHVKYEAAGTTYWTRPGKDDGVSATTGHSSDGVDRLFVFSTSAAPFEDQQPYSKFAALAILEHGGDFSAAARDLASKGYGSPDPFVSPLGYIDATPSGDIQASPETPDRVRTSWWPRDLAATLADTEGEPAPAYLARDDGNRLFYAGKVNGLLGESESGKTWVALLAVAQALEAGDAVLYLDFEDTPRGIVSRLRAMDSPDDQIGQLTYVSPDESLGTLAQEDLRELLREHRPKLIILDGVNAAMTVQGLKLEDNADATRFAQTLLVPLSRTGAAVVTVDHIPKSRENRGKGGIGAQAKRAMTTGSAFLVEVIEPFGRGRTGKLKLTVDKDRPGHVRGFSSASAVAGFVILGSTTDAADPFSDAGKVSVTVEKPRAPDVTPEAKRDRTHVERRRSLWDACQTSPIPLSANKLAEKVGGDRNAMLAIIKEMGAADFLRWTDDGYVAGFRLPDIQAEND